MSKVDMSKVAMIRAELQRSPRDNGSSLDEHPCSDCSSQLDIPGDCHIECSTPGGQILRPRLWPGCGFFPFCFDQNIVLACEYQQPKQCSEDSDGVSQIR